MDRHHINKPRWHTTDIQDQDFHRKPFKKQHLPIRLKQADCLTAERKKEATWNGRTIILKGVLNSWGFFKITLENTRIREWMQNNGKTDDIYSVPGQIRIQTLIERTQWKNMTRVKTMQLKLQSDRLVQRSLDCAKGRETAGPIPCSLQYHHPACVLHNCKVHSLKAGSCTGALKANCYVPQTFKNKGMGWVKGFL